MIVSISPVAVADIGAHAMNNVAPKISFILSLICPLKVLRQQCGHFVEYILIYDTVIIPGKSGLCHKVLKMRANHLHTPMIISIILSQSRYIQLDNLPLR